MNKISVKFLRWGVSGFRAFDQARYESKDETGIDVEVKCPDRSRTTLRVTIDADGSVHTAEPVSWEPISRESVMKPKKRC